MMTEARDPVLQSLFDQPRHVEDNQEFVARVVARTRRLRYQLIGALAALALMLLAGAWVLSIPVQATVFSITQVLTTALFDLGESWTAWLLAPVNNIASLLIISLKATRMVWKKIKSATWSN
jgi:hypothetical protein